MYIRFIVLFKHTRLLFTFRERGRARATRSAVSGLLAIQFLPSPHSPGSSGQMKSRPSRKLCGSISSSTHPGPATARRPIFQRRGTS